ncbi:hypothetical protein HELRODRAFT_186177 [Helobdella robusta]|uniref:Hepatocellular carcinoma-associated antigen 59 domain-containing protein n=1 Tax=Helobdella robusta TaxID=6412 RepID=T1FNR9_HELRO|nr:hypothetical protein HELRODRAFT_186177 [Helobdella robusta]ESN92068.1 hypothetical protein HELRODRAFT_186177 [Helobdella robusta]
MAEIIKKRRKNVRQRQDDDEDDEDQIEIISAILEETKELQKLRKKPNGVSIEDLATIKTETKERKNMDHLKLKTGGFVDIKKLKKELSKVEDIDQIGTNFAMETNQRDEDAMMLNYVEEQMAKYNGAKEEEDEKKEESHNQSLSEDILFQLPESIKFHPSSKKKTEESISNQMLSGIPEVDLGIGVKIKNIEETEAAKQRLMKERLMQRDKGISHFVPTNVAVNFAQHNRYNLEDSSQPNRRMLSSLATATPKPTPQFRVGDAEKPDTCYSSTSRPTSLVATNATTSGAANEKATDDFHYEKFKRHLKRF